MKKTLIAIAAACAAFAANAGPTFGVFIYSAHDHNGFRSVTPGVYMLAENGFTAGAYLNSIDKVSALAGWTWRHDRYAVTFAGVTGYERKVTPAIVPSVRLGNVRVALVLERVLDKRGANALTFSWEF